MLKVALVGVGGISGAHINGWMNTEGASLTAICDIREERLNLYPSFNHYFDFDEMLEKEQPDILDICLPTYLHCEFALKALKRGINVLCEKPVSLNENDAELLYRTAEEAGVKFMVAQVIRFWPEYELLKKAYDEKTYGELLSGTMFRLSKIPSWSWDGWMFDKNRSGLVPFDLHIHDLDFLVYAFGEPKNVEAHRSERPEQDYISNKYVYDNFFINAEAAWYASPYPFKSGYRFQFENAVFEYTEGTLTIYEKDGKIYNPIGASDADNGDIGLPASDAYAEEIKYFTNCVTNNITPSKVNPEELKTVITILNKI